MLADFNWKFALGHANDPAKDFGWGRGSAFAKSGSLIGGRNGVTGTNFDDTKWQSVQLPHDWAIDLPFSGQTQSQLVEGQDMEVKQRQSLFNCEQHAETIGKRLGWDKDPDRRKRIGRGRVKDGL